MKLVLLGALATLFFTCIGCKGSRLTPTDPKTVLLATSSSIGDRVVAAGELARTASGRVEIADAASDVRPVVRMIVASKLDNPSNDEILLLGHLANDADRGVAVMALQKLQDAGHAPRIVHDLIRKRTLDSDDEVRATAGAALASFRDMADTVDFRRLSRDPNLYVRMIVVHAVDQYFPESSSMLPKHTRISQNDVDSAKLALTTSRGRTTSQSAHSGNGN